MPKKLTIHLLSALMFCGCAMPSWAGQVAVPMDEVRIIAFKQPVSSVYIGNPVIADVNTIDPTHVFVLGKTFGSTNLIALGGNGRPIANEKVVVFGQRMGMVTLQKGSSQYTYTCTAAHCETSPQPGDQHGWYNDVNSDVEKHQDMGSKGALASAVH